MNKFLNENHSRTKNKQPENIINSNNSPAIGKLNNLDETTEEDTRDPPTTPTNTREGSGSGPNSGKSPDSRPASPETQEIPGMFILRYI